MKFTGIRVMAQHFQCDHKTINKYINKARGWASQTGGGWPDKLFRNEWYIKLDS